VTASGVTSTSSLFVVYRSDWGLTPANIATVFAAYVGTLLPALLVMSGVANRYPRRVLLTVGLVLSAVGVASLALAQGMPMLIFARLAQGLGVGVSIGALTAAFSESYRGKLAQGTAIQIMAAIGLATGPMITAVAWNLGGGLHWSYVPTLVLAVGVIALVPWLPERPAVARALAAVDAAGGEATLPAATVWRGLTFAMLVIFVSWASLSIFLSLMPSYLATTLQAGNPMVGAVAIAVTQASSLGATVWFRRGAPERNGVWAPVVMVTGLVVLVVGTQGNVPALVAVATVLVGGGAGVAAAAAFGVAERVSVGQRDKVFARMYVAGYLGYSVPAMVIGAVASRWGLTAGIVTVVVGLAGVVGMVGATSRRVEVTP
ncbi:MAG: MFS transporter, partial [Gemmatimonadota bacterium]